MPFFSHQRFFVRFLRKFNSFPDLGQYPREVASFQSMISKRRETKIKIIIIVRRMLSVKNLPRNFLLRGTRIRERRRSQLGIRVCNKKKRKKFVKGTPSPDSILSIGTRINRVSDIILPTLIFHENTACGLEV